MTWVRLDDKFPSHPKITTLTDREFRVHIRVLCYCAEYKTRGRIPATLVGEVRGLTEKIAEKFVRVGLWDEGNDGCHAVHDFEAYNPRDPFHAQRQARYRDRHRDAPSDAPSDAPVTDSVTPGVIAGTRAQTPSPTPLAKGTSDSQNISTEAKGPAAADDDLSILETDLRTLGLNPEQTARALFAPELAQAWYDRATTDPNISNPAGYFWHGLTTGQAPAAPHDATAPKKTGWRRVRGSHGDIHVEDPDGTDTPPPDARRRAHTARSQNYDLPSGLEPRLNGPPPERPADPEPSLTATVKETMAESRPVSPSTIVAFPLPEDRRR